MGLGQVCIYKKDCIEGRWKKARQQAALLITSPERELVMGQDFMLRCFLDYLAYLFDDKARKP